MSACLLVQGVVIKQDTSVLQTSMLRLFAWVLTTCACAVVFWLAAALTSTALAAADPCGTGTGVLITCPGPSPVAAPKPSPTPSTPSDPDFGYPSLADACRKSGACRPAPAPPASAPPASAPPAPPPPPAPSLAPRAPAAPQPKPAPQPTRAHPPQPKTPPAPQRKVAPKPTTPSRSPSKAERPLNTRPSFKQTPQPPVVPPAVAVARTPRRIVDRCGAGEVTSRRNSSCLPPDLTAGGGRTAGGCASGASHDSSCPAPGPVRHATWLPAAAMPTIGCSQPTRRRPARKHPGRPQSPRASRPPNRWVTPSSGEAQGAPRPVPEGLDRRIGR